MFIYLFIYFIISYLSVHTLCNYTSISTTQKELRILNMLNMLKTFLFKKVYLTKKPFLLKTKKLRILNILCSWYALRAHIAYMDYTKKLRIFNILNFFLCVCAALGSTIQQSIESSVNVPVEQVVDPSIRIYYANVAALIAILLRPPWTSSSHCTYWVISLCYSHSLVSNTVQELWQFLAEP